MFAPVGWSRMNGVTGLLWRNQYFLNIFFKTNFKKSNLGILLREEEEKEKKSVTLSAFSNVCHVFIDLHILFKNTTD